MDDCKKSAFPFQLLNGNIVTAKEQLHRIRGTAKWTISPLLATHGGIYVLPWNLYGDYNNKELSAGDGSFSMLFGDLNHDETKPIRRICPAKKSRIRLTWEEGKLE